MLENVKYNLGREYKFYATILSGQRSKKWAEVLMKKRNSIQKTKYKNDLLGGGGSESLHNWEGKEKEQYTQYTYSQQTW